MSKVIWTSHLRERIRQRGLNPDWVDKAVRFPDEIQASTTTNSRKHLKVIQGYRIVAAVKKQAGDWIITSAWWNPITTGNRRSNREFTDRRFFLEKWIDGALRKLEKFLISRKRS